MKRILHIALIAVLALSCVKGPTELRLSTQSMEVPVEGAQRMLSVTCDGAWALNLNASDSWCTTDVTSGKGNGTVSVTVSRNEAEDERSTQLVFSAEGLSPVTVTVTQKGTASSVVIPDDPENLVSPDPASGITVEPAYPNADEACVIKFNPQSGNPLYNHSGDLYGHLGVVVEGEWMFVPTDWGTTDKKTRFTKVADNSWELKLEPSIREYFGSGQTPLNMIAIIVRSADGSIKSHDADQFCSVKEEKYFNESFTPDPLVFETMPAGVRHGINYNDNGSVTFVLYDKDKDGKRFDYCYIVGDWNEWERVKEGAMKRDNEAGCWWITLDGFDADKEYRFQYRLGNQPSSDIRVSDPYTEIVYDQWNDQYIDGVPAFPEGARQLVSAFQINRPEYSWKHSDFKVEDKNDLVIYEMLFRDFTTSQDIAGAMERLDYIENLGVNAVQLMPVQEFDGNNSWGYNPNHWFALDKYYGTREEYKAFIDECHSRGLAVIIDVVYNHATGSHPWAKMWWSGSATAENNPFFNVLPTHPYNVYHDMNHENAMVKEHVKRSLEYLLTEYDVDGFRFDLTKGFTQKQTDPDVAAWGRYDQSRVDILKGYADHIWSVNSDAVVIFEHLSDWDEEKVLAQHGIQLWRNVNHEYRSAVSGGQGNFSNMYSTAPFGGFVGYMESHDEERLCYGATSSTASVTWGICGTLTSWGSSPDISMTADGPFFVAKNVTFTADDMFKIRGNSSWDDAFNYGASTKGYKLPLDKEYQLTVGSGSQDMAVPAAGSYDVYFSPDVQKIWLMTVGKRPAAPAVNPGETEDALTVAMRRAGASAAFFLTVPGPKMIWQFGEIGYDYSIDYNDRTGEKPVVTDEYMAVPERKALYDTYAVLLKFRRENPRFFDNDADFEWTPTGTLKKITCSVDGKTFHVVGNFGKSSTGYTVPAGSWTDYINGGAVSGNITLKQGEFRLLTDF
ncbi:MAG: alpha-amylase [Bacteroidales bacterium]|nr:alpha-amylase [Bacteroidales bacterium]